ncbi:MAG TPA: lysylphosphatidylglycerol synthase transmembrane domain-containing protein [Solirubrobacter sp.]|nr:lysylphosphatidylglycerol synthase transmembrane domain-containing protein [Solirubrobacter sp.]
MISDTSDHPIAAVAPPAAAAPRRRRSPLSWLGILVSVVALAAIVYWASKQQAPQLPDTPTEFLALIGAIALYALATVVRSERWQRLLVDEGAKPHRADTYALTVVGYMGNNVLPARAGDAIRVMLMAPRAETSKRTVVGTLLAERLLDVVVLVVLFVVVGYGLLGEVGGDSVELIAIVAIVGVAALAVGWRLVTKNERLHGALAPIASATLGMRRAHHGLRLLGMTLVIWAIETGVWMATAAAVGFHMNVIEGMYMVALASVFSLIPSGPAYAGTQDSAVIVGSKALGASGSTALAYLLMLRFVIVVPITVAGLILLVARYGGWSKLRAARAEARS